MGEAKKVLKQQLKCPAVYPSHFLHCSKLEDGGFLDKLFFVLCRYTQVFFVIVGKGTLPSASMPSGIFF